MNLYAMNQGTKAMTLKYSAATVITTTTTTTTATTTTTTTITTTTATTAQEYKLANDITTLENLNTFTFTDSGIT